MDGILPIYKEAGMTSHDVVSKLRRILNMKKIGHAGTLDPSVDGVLPIALGKATKTIEFLQETGKTYTGEITFGIATTTEDMDGEVIETKQIKTIGIVGSGTFKNNITHYKICNTFNIKNA